MTAGRLSEPLGGSGQSTRWAAAQAALSTNVERVGMREGGREVPLSAPAVVQSNSSRSFRKLFGFFFGYFCFCGSGAWLFA